MTPRPSEPRWCNQTGCDTKVILARRAGEDRWVPLEARDFPPFSDHAAGALVVVDQTAWRLSELIEHFQTRFEVTEDAARELVSGYPAHRTHYHEPTTNGATA